MSLLTLTDVNYKNIIRHCSLQISEKKTTFICGKSGTGKSTLLKMFNGILTPDSGKITFLGKELSSYDPIQLRRELLFVSQNPYLFEGTIRDNFKTYYGYRGQEVIDDQEIIYYLTQCSCSLPLETEVYNLSGGERLRLFLAINMSFKPQVLMLDEPTSALDELTASLVLSNIKRHCQKNEQSLIVISHDKKLIHDYADSIIHLSGGKDLE